MSLRGASCWMDAGSQDGWPAGKGWGWEASGSSGDVAALVQVLTTRTSFLLSDSFRHCFCFIVLWNRRFVPDLRQVVSSQGRSQLKMETGSLLLHIRVFAF